MKKSTPAPKARKTTLQSLTKIPAVNGLYRHENGTYYGKKKIRGVKRVLALTTANGANISDRKLAEKALAAWVGVLKKPAPVGAGMSFAELLERLAATQKGKSEKTHGKITWVRRCFDFDGPQILTMRIDEIKPSHLSEFFAARSKKLGAHAHNDMSRIIKNAFELATGDEILASSPYDKVPKNIRRRKLTSEPANVPTIAQCEAICAHVRNQEFSDTAERSADMLEFMHRAALGTAECIYADWSKVNWEGKYVEVKRQKTGVYFRVPFYDHLMPFLVDLHERQGKPTTGSLFSILSPKKALYNACSRLKLSAYSPIDLRKARIVWMLRKGVPVETLAKWQGHKDNGVLIRRTYSWVISESDNAYELEQLAKLTSKAESPKI